METLFHMLDVDGDGELSRTDLHTAARRLGWQWQEAPIFALLDLLTLRTPLRKRRFIEYMQQTARDPMGPYSAVLGHSPFSSRISVSKSGPEAHPVPKEIDIHAFESQPEEPPKGSRIEITELLERTAGSEIADRYRLMCNILDPVSVSVDNAALLIIDPQRSFTSGAWMRSMGFRAEADVEPIGLAFDHCAVLLREWYPKMEVMFTRCPFPPESYDWDDRIGHILDDSQPYFIKPGNSVMFPPENGFIPWVERCIAAGRRTLAIGGCTLNSCVRVSAVETAKFFSRRGFRVVVDLNLSGARLKNFIPSALFGNASAVESAVEQMRAAGVCVAREVLWTI